MSDVVTVEGADVGVDTELELAGGTISCLGIGDEAITSRPSGPFYPSAAAPARRSLAVCSSPPGIEGDEAAMSERNTREGASSLGVRSERNRLDDRAPRRR